MPFSKSSSTCHWRNRETHPDRCYQPSDVPAVQDPSGNPTCMALLPEPHGVKSLQMCPATRCPLLLRSSVPPSPLSFSPLCVPAAVRAPSPAALCRGAAPGHSCLSAPGPSCHELSLSHEPGPAQQHSTSPRHCNHPSGGFADEPTNLRHSETIEDISPEVQVRGKFPAVSP